MNITPDVLGPDVLLDGAIKMGKSLSLSDSESLGLVIRLAELTLGFTALKSPGNRLAMLNVQPDLRPPAAQEPDQEML